MFNRQLNLVILDKQNKLNELSENYKCVQFKANHTFIANLT